MMNILFVSLGCDKNLVDSEVMLGLLAEKGYGFTDDEMEADVIVVNTCCFIGDAKEESVNTILEMAEHKKDAKCKALIVLHSVTSRRSLMRFRKWMQCWEPLPTTALSRRWKKHSAASIC